MIGDLNRRVIIKAWGSTTDEAGGVIPVETASYPIWAKVEDRSGRTMTGEQQREWSYDYKVTFRYEKSRVAISAMTIDYDSKRLTINSLSYQNEGTRKYCIARCSATDLKAVFNNGTGDGSEGSVDADLNLLFRVGDEGAPVTGETEFVVPQLIGLTTDQFSVFRNGLPMWPDTEYSFDSSTGKITLIKPSDKFYLGEQFLFK